MNSLSSFLLSRHDHLREGLWLSRCVAIVATLLIASQANAVTIDDFSDGAFSGSSDPDWFIVRNVQQGLATTAVIGGSRDLFAMYGGELAFTAGAGDQLVYDHNRDDFEVFSINYGSTSDPSSVALNTDLTAGDADHLLIRVAENIDYVPTSRNWYGEPELRLSFRSGVDEGAAEWGSVGMELLDSTDPYLLAIPLATIFSNSGATTGPDWTDIDAVYLSFEGIGRSGRRRLVLDSIETGALLTGDATGDGVIDGADLAEMQRFYGTSASVAADFNRDGIVNAADYTVWRDASAATQAVTAVPEPAGAGLILLVFACPLMRSLTLR